MIDYTVYCWDSLGKGEDEHSLWHRWLLLCPHLSMSCLSLCVVNPP